MTYVVEYRTKSIEHMTYKGELDHIEGDFWYEGDNEAEYPTYSEAIEKSDTINDWRAGKPTDLTSVRIRNTITGVITFVSPFPAKPAA